MGLQRRLSHTGLSVHSVPTPGTIATSILPGPLLGPTARSQSADVGPSKTQGPRTLGKLFGYRKRPLLHFRDTDHPKPWMDGYWLAGGWM